MCLTKAHASGFSNAPKIRSDTINSSGMCGREAQMLGLVVDFLGFHSTPAVFHQGAFDVHCSSPHPFPGMPLHLVTCCSGPKTPGMLAAMLKPTAASSATLTSWSLID